MTQKKSIAWWKVFSRLKYFTLDDLSFFFGIKKNNRRKTEKKAMNYAVR